ncbi:coronin-1C-A-like [Asterias rubens]|uniref:coronin-1C-A-like n=1 Tax=Asterias rubens TaxID=7604 RepID=UPI00145502B6|nr:coronin-1C-A-like [Asterias rubens]
MAGKFVRSSKFRHVFGTSAKAEQQFTFIRGVNDGTTDGHICAVNPKFVALATKPQGGGAFLVFKLDEPSRVDPDHPQVRGHKGKVLDLAWNPFDDNIIASGDEYAAVYLWNIPDEGLDAEKALEPMLKLDYHEKKIVKLMWHPTAENILMTAAQDCKVLIWNLESASVITEVPLPDMPFGVAFDYNGGRFAVTAKDKKIRVFDSHSGALQKEWDGHEGSKPQMVTFVKQGIFTTGFDKMSARQFALWDEKTGKNKELDEIDQSNGVNVITYDRDTGMIYLAAKGDSVIRYYEITDEAPYIFWLSSFQEKPQTFAAAMPKRGCDVNQNEVMRFYRIEKSSKGNTNHFVVIPTAMTVPRKSDLFQDDLFPDTPGYEAALTADQWEEGATKDPILVSLKTAFKPKVKEVRVGKTVNKVSGFTKKVHSGDSSAAASGASSTELKALQDEVKSLKSTVSENTSTIKELQSKLDDLAAKVGSSN